MEIVKLKEMSKEYYEKMRYRSSRDILKEEVFADIKKIGDIIQAKGDEGVVEVTRDFDKVNLSVNELRVKEREFTEAVNKLDKRVIDAIEVSIKNHWKYNEKLLPPKISLYELDNGIVGGRKVSPLNRVGLYCPFGKGSYPSSFITIAVPAVIAGVKDIDIIVPPKPDGSVDSAVLAAAQILGLKNIYRANGVAGVLAAAFGTEKMPKVDKIVGPGGEYIMAAQMYAQLQGVSVALFFGPSECMIIADDTADSRLIAADLINEAEHGMNSSAILITDSEALALKVQKEIPVQLSQLPEWRRKYAESAMKTYGGIILVENMDQAVDLANEWGNEHIQVATKDPWSIVHKIDSASEILVTQWTPFSAISYCIGVPACLPTGQFARIYSGVTVDTFLKFCAVTELKREGLEKLKETIKNLSQYEEFPAHTQSIFIRESSDMLERK